MLLGEATVEKQLPLLSDYVLPNQLELTLCTDKCGQSAQGAAKLSGSRPLADDVILQRKSCTISSPQ